MERWLCVHGHFYQPPRENPWLEAVEQEDSARPFHDWNERITSECYEPNTRARILDGEAYIRRIADNYLAMSFNFGPTLLSWMERARPSVYAAIVEADQKSRRIYSGHGSAVAQVYNHVIMPLANARDRRTQVRWGMRDFQHRFGRKPEGMWLAETAVNLETLDALAREGIEFTILAPHQAKSPIDPRRPYRVSLPGGRSIAVFFYDSGIAHDVAFGRILEDGQKFANRLVAAFDRSKPGPQLVHVATDGETYGHHHRFGEMALAYAIDDIQSRALARVTNYGEYLARFPPDREVEIAENTAWSCAHGIERWKSNCGCASGGQPGWTQTWRAPLRESLDWLRDELADLFDRRGRAIFSDPWSARDEYIELILDRSLKTAASFLERHAGGILGADERIAAFELLEMQRQAMLMFTSCGWFFDEVSGIETVQVLRYAGRAVQLASRHSAAPLEKTLLEKLAAAKSNIAEEADARSIYERRVRPAAVDLSNVVAHYAVSSLFHRDAEGDGRAKAYAYSIDDVDRQALWSGRAKLAVGRVRATSDITGESALLAYGVLHFGDHNLSAGVRAFRGEAEYEVMAGEVTRAFQLGQLPEVLRLLDRHFVELRYSLTSLFKDEQRRVLDLLLADTLAEAESSSAQLNRTHGPLIAYAASLDYALPKPLRTAVDFVLNTALREQLSREQVDFDRVRRILAEALALKVEIDASEVPKALLRVVERLRREWLERPADLDLLDEVIEAVSFAKSLPYYVDLTRLQDTFYALVHAGTAAGDRVQALGELLRVRVRAR